MPRSMTGFGVAEGPVAGGRLHMEIRTVNHRHFNAQVKVPGNLKELEVPVREHLRSVIDRGHVTLVGRWMEEPRRESEVRLNLDRARDMVRAFEQLKSALGLPGEIDAAFIARQPEVLVVSAAEEPTASWPEMRGVLDTVLEAVLAARSREGDALAKELARRLGAITVQLDTVEERAPKRLAAERDRLARTVAELLDGRRLDEARLAQEIALLAEKLDITEEIVRLRAHLELAASVIVHDAPVGKQLGFLAQEMLREINTIGSKANDVPIAHAVIAMKGELEKFREQVENVE